MASLEGEMGEVQAEDEKQDKRIGNLEAGAEGLEAEIVELEKEVAKLSR